MALNYEQLMSMSAFEQESSYSDQQTMLYAISVGLGADPMDRQELDYVFEGGLLKTVPTMASVVAKTRLLHGCGWDYTQVLHGEQRLTLYRSLPPQADIVTNSKVTAAFDKGVGKGALIYAETEVRMAKTDVALCTVGSTIFARGDGGFGGPAGSGPAVHELPTREPDMSCALPTRADQALLYRLNGDRNPLHANPELALKVGFAAPILHGLCTYGIACRAVLQTICHYDHTLIRSFDVRFSAPVYPGETVLTEMWQDGNVVSFRCRVPERGVVVINNGKCELAW